MCESLLNKDIAKDDISINGFSPEPLRVDKPENIRNGVVCLYFKENLPMKERRDLEILPETIVAEIKLSRKNVFLYFLIAIELDEYVKSLERIYERINQENPAVTILNGDFNARSPLFWVNDTENSVFNHFLTSNNLEELINEPTHIRDDGSNLYGPALCFHRNWRVTLPRSSFKTS